MAIEIPALVECRHVCVCVCGVHRTAPPRAPLRQPPYPGCRRSKFKLCWKHVVEATAWEELSGQLSVAEQPGSWEQALQPTPLYQVSCRGQRTGRTLGCVPSFFGGLLSVCAWMGRLLRELCGRACKHWCMAL